MNIYDPIHWNKITEEVFRTADTFFHRIKKRKVKSMVLSDLYEEIAAEYFSSIGIKAKSSTHDSEPDLFFPELKKSCEIKVTGLTKSTFKKCVWIGGGLSKRNSDFIFVAWNSSPELSTLFHTTTPKYEAILIKSYVEEHEWKADISKSGKKQEFHGKKLDSKYLLTKEHTILLGKNNTVELVCDPINLG